MKVSDAYSIRANTHECTVWLAIIFSWLTPYSWAEDLLIVIVVSIINAAVVKSSREEGLR